MLAAATQALKLRQCTLKRFAPHGTLRLTGLHRREHARCIAILHRARQPRWWQLCPALAVIDPGPAAVLTDLIIEVTSEPQLRRIQNGRCVEHRLGRSEERRGGKECVSTCRYRWSPYRYKQKTKKITIELHTK